jgi:hypothetical protein
LNLLLICLGVAGLLFGRYHRDRVATRFEKVLTEEKRTPKDIKAMKEELAEVDMTREQLASELDGRAKFLQSLKSENFYLSIDTQQKKLRFYYGPHLLREGDITVGEAKTVKAGADKSWTFVPLKGALPVEGKVVDHPWRVPEWVYAMTNKPVPASRPVIEGGLGRYVLFLPNNYVVHTPPVEGSPLTGAKPGSFMVSEDDLRAIWPRIQPGKTFVYVF